MQQGVKSYSIQQRPIRLSGLIKKSLKEMPLAQKIDEFLITEDCKPPILMDSFAFVTCQLANII